MQEIVTVDGVTRLFVALAVLSPVVGLLVAGIMTVRRAERGDVRRRGLLIGLSGPGNWLLWQLYNALTERNGLDTVRNFGINLVVFVLIGVVLGLVLSRVQPAGRAEVMGPDQAAASVAEDTVNQAGNGAEPGA